MREGTNQQEMNVPASSGGSVLRVLQREGVRIAPMIGRLAVEDRRVDLGGGTTGFRGPTFERRLAIAMEMAERLKSAEIAALIAPCFARLVQEWRDCRLDINDTVELLRAIDAVTLLATGDVEEMRGQVEAAVLEEARAVYRSDELRELISVIDTTERDHPAIAVARSSFERYQQLHFGDDLRECRSREQFNGLLEDLELFRDELGVDVAALIQRVDEAKSEFEEHEDAYADHMQDEWKERYRFERDADRSVSEMFGSLRGDQE
jgi:hypothetical protein